MSQSPQHTLLEHDILAGITSSALTAVPVAVHASITWARGRWLVGRAPTHAAVAGLDALQAELRQGPALDALRNQHIVTVEDTGSEARWPPFAARARAAHVGIMVCLPLRVNGECCGVLNLYAALPRAFSAQDERTATAFADQAALGLSRAVDQDQLRNFAGPGDSIAPAAA